MRMRALLPLVATFGLLVACGDDGESLFGEAAETDDTDDEEPGDTDAPAETTGVATDPPPDDTDGEPTTEETTGPFDGGDDTPFTFPTLPDTGDSSSTPAGGMEELIVDEFAKGFSEDPMFSEDDGRCIGQSLFDELGMDGLIEIGEMPDPEDWPPDVLNTLMEAMWDCIDFRAMMIDELTSTGATQEQAQCVWDAFTDDEWKEFLLASAMGEDRSVFEQELESRASGCV